MKVDPGKHKELYLKWKESGSVLNGISEQNAEILRNYFEDMEFRSEMGSRLT